MPIAAVVRPGETEFDQAERVQGTLNLPPNDRGKTQVGEIVDALRNLSIKQIYTSPHDPALTTAQLMGAALGIGIKEIGDLTNVDYGLWQGLCIDEIKRKHPKVFKQWNESPESVCPPGGETCEEAYQRATKALRKPLKRKDNFAVVSSEPMATLLKCVLRGEEPRLSAPCGRDNGSLVELIEMTKPEAAAVAE